MPLTFPSQIESAVKTATIHRRARCWRITRADVPTIIYRFTEHPRPLILEDGKTYDPTDGVQTTAHRKENELDPENKELRGIVSLTSSLLTDELLRSRKLINAEVVEFLVDWGFPWKPAIETSKFWIRELKFHRGVWQATCSGLLEWLEARVGEVHGPLCRVEVFSQGDFKCNLASTSYLQALRSVTAVGADPRMDLTFTFDLAQLGVTTDTFFDEGTVEWKTGPNDGLVSRIATHDFQASNLAVLQLMEPTPFDISIGDQADILPGCNKAAGIFDTTGHCKHKWNVNNIRNFQGEPILPGQDALTKSIPLGGLVKLT